MKTNKYRSLFNENMTELQASTIFFRESYKLKDNKEEGKLLAEAWHEADRKIGKRILEEVKKGWFIQAEQ